MVAVVKEEIAKMGGNPRWTVTSDKFNHEFIVEKSNDGFVFFHITISRGSLPKELSGHYMRSQDALEAVMRYEFSAKPTATVERDRKAEMRAEQKENS